MIAAIDLETEIKKRLAAAEERRRAAQDEIRQTMGEVERDLHRFEEIGDRLVRQVICPRLQKMASYFPNVEFLRPQAEELRHSCICRFRPTARFPATALLKVAVSHDDTFEKVVITCRLEVEPHHYDFDSHQISFPLDAIDQEELAHWLDEQLLLFVDTYLRLEEVEPYQVENLVLNPVCGMVINKNHAAGQAVHQGRLYYFCVEACQKKFTAEPSRYVPPSKSG